MTGLASYDEPKFDGYAVFAILFALCGPASAGPAGGTVALSLQGSRRSVLEATGAGGIDDQIILSPGLQAALMPTDSSVLQVEVARSWSGEGRFEGSFATRTVAGRLARHTTEVTAAASGARIPTRHVDAQLMHYPERLGVGMAFHRATLPTLSRWSESGAGAASRLIDPSARLTTVGILVRRDPVLEWLRGAELADVGLSVADSAVLTLGGEVQAGVGSVGHSLVFEHTVRSDSDASQVSPSTFVALDATLEPGVLVERELTRGRLWAHAGMSVRALRTGPAIATGTTNNLSLIHI